jgi:hypothetical protein
MPIIFDDQNEGKTLAVQLRGKLTKADYVYFVPEFERLVCLNGKLRVIVDLVDFHGWEAGALWEDIKFNASHFNDIERLALVGDKEWERGMASFCKPFTRAKIQYFDRKDAAEAGKWLREP